MLKDPTQCSGCVNIEEQEFPFGSSEKKKHAIGTEGCGVFDEDDYSWLEIFFCPVCGRKLEDD